MEFSAIDFQEFYLEDRNCRKIRPTASNYLQRALALDRLGFRENAGIDLEKADEFGVNDLPILGWIFRHHPDQGKRFQAARRLVSHDRAGREDINAALDCLLSRGNGVVHHGARRGLRLQGWVAALELGEPWIDLRFGDGRQIALPLTFDRAVPGARAGLRAPFDLPANPSLSVAIRGRVGGVSSDPSTICPAISASLGSEKSSGASIGLSVVIPIYGDSDCLTACLKALSEQSAFDIVFIVIDDASPDPAVAEIGRRFCKDMNGTYHRCLVNGGFAAAVNLGLSLCPQGDVLLLNSDVVLPSGALERLRAAAQSAMDIGTVSPLSNDSGETGFPDPLHANALLDTVDLVEVDEAAQAANAGQVTDLLAPLGSCLYVTKTALSRVGPLSLLYGRGYYEDVDFYLRVRQAGLRNVAACDVYVSHRGGRSFGSEKRALVARNHLVLTRRFPDYELDDVVFDFADPLRKVRAAIEERLRPRLNHAVVVVGRATGGEALFDERTKAWRALGRPVLLMRWSGAGHTAEIDLGVAEGPGPRSLRFELTNDGNERVLTYLQQFDGIEVEVLEPEDLPSVLVRLLKKLDRPLAVLIESWASAATLVAELSAPFKCWRLPAFIDRPALGRVIPLDRMAAAWLEQEAPSRSLSSPGPPRKHGRKIGKLGVSLPVDDAAAELFLLSLARILRRERDTTLIILGRAIDERQLMSPGNVWVTGPMLGDDPGVVATQYGIDALLSPYRTSMFWHVESLGRRLGVPIAYFDWSMGRLAEAAEDLALHHRFDDATASRNIVAWCSGQPSTCDNAI